MSKLDFDMTMKEFRKVIKMNIAAVILKHSDHDMTEEEIEEYNFMADISGTGREMGFARIVTKKRGSNTGHLCRVRGVKCVDDGWEFELRLL